MYSMADQHRSNNMLKDKWTHKATQHWRTSINDVCIHSGHCTGKLQSQPLAQCLSEWGTCTCTACCSLQKPSGEETETVLCWHLMTIAPLVDYVTFFQPWQAGVLHLWWHRQLCTCTGTETATNTLALTTVPWLQKCQQTKDNVRAQWHMCNIICSAMTHVQLHQNKNNTNAPMTLARQHVWNSIHTLRIS